jgi:mitogen-activated protein kinase kinase kinase
MCTASLEESLFTIKGSVPWMAPEVIKQSGHGRSSDVWSLGAMIIEMATAKPPWPDFTNNLAALFHVATSTSPPPFPEVLSSEGKAFLGRCLVIDPKHRAAAADLLTDPFLPLSEATGGSVGGIVSNDMKPSNESKK